MSKNPIRLEDATILVTGPTSQVGLPIARELARHNKVYGLARFTDAESAERMRALGVTPIQADLATDSLEAVPAGIDYVLHFAVTKTGDFAADLAANAEGAGRLLAHCSQAKAFLHCSSGAVYQYAGQRPIKESDPLGDNHRAMMPTYSLAKIAAEAVVGFACKQYGVPTTIVRLSVPYGDNGGWPWYHLLMMKAGHKIPVHAEGPNRYNPIHEDDYLALLPRLLAVAAVPATTLNLGGHDIVSIEDWCVYLGELTGLTPEFQVSRSAIGSLVLDLTRMHELVGTTRVDWRDGVRRMVEARAPELLR